MDTLGGQFSDPEGADDGAEERAVGGTETLAPLIGGDERRMQVRAYNFWASLLGSRTFPDIADLHPDQLPDFGPFSVLLDFSDGLENPAISYLGAELAEECGMATAICRLQDVPSRSLLSRITDHYMQILANQAPIGFEAEFVNQRGATILYRGILLPFSRDDTSIDHIFGVINWKELAQPAIEAPPAPIEDPADPRRGLLRGMPMSEWADGPVSAIGAFDASFSATAELPFAQFGLHADSFEEAALAIDPDAMALADWLAAARDEASHARSCEDRSRAALYAAIGRAYDFALAAADAPEDYAELIEDAGISVQERAPLIPLVKLVFGADYDKTRLTEFASCIAYGQRQGVARGELAALIAGTPGGLKAIVAEERRLRRGGAAAAEPAQTGHDALLAGLRQLSPQPLDGLARSAEFTVLVARRGSDGELELLGEVDDEALLDRAARRLLG